MGSFVMKGTMLEAADRLKDLAYDLGAIGVEATFSNTGHTVADEWTTIKVHQAALLSDSQDGWDVEVTETSL